MEKARTVTDDGERALDADAMLKILEAIYHQLEKSISENDKRRSITDCLKDAYCHLFEGYEERNMQALSAEEKM